MNVRTIHRRGKRRSRSRPKEASLLLVIVSYAAATTLFLQAQSDLLQDGNRAFELRLMMNIDLGGENRMKRLPDIATPPKEPDYGYVVYRKLGVNETRTIKDDPLEWQGEVHPTNPYAREDDVDQYYAFDDDFYRSSYYAYDDDLIQDERQCRRVGWHRMLNPNCNSMHELGWRSKFRRTLGSGGFYDVFRADHVLLENREEIAFKQIRYQWEFSHDNMEAVRVDALVNERLSSNPRIVDIFGYCGMSMLSEYMPSGNLEQVFAAQLHEDEEYGELSPEDKFVIVSEVAVAIASLHGFRDGVIVHGNLDLSQLLFNEEGYVKLNDFNRAEILLFDEDDQKYCKYENGPSVTTGAPEEHMLDPIDESADVYSFGAILYTVLTGLFLYAPVTSEADYNDFVQNGDMASAVQTVSGKSLVEDKLLDLMIRCLEFHPEKRPSIFDILGIVEDAVMQVEHSEDGFEELR